MKFLHVLRSVYTEPWLIQPAMHLQISQIVQAHINGDAHKAGGIMDMFAEPEKPEFSVQDNVAIIPIKGVIGRDVGNLEKSSGVCDVNDVQDMLDLAMSAQDIKAVVLNIDSPGGSVSGTPELGESIYKMRDVKPIVAHTCSMMASAAYWLGSQASALYAATSSIVGSIGVYMPVLDSSRAYEMQGLKQEVFKAGKFKGAGIPGTSLTDAQRDMIQARVDHIHDQFRATVRRGRGINISDEVMEGQDFYGDQAVSIGLVDGIANLPECIETAKALAQIQ